MMMVLVMSRIFLDFSDHHDSDDAEIKMKRGLVMQMMTKMNMMKKMGSVMWAGSLVDRRDMDNQ